MDDSGEADFTRLQDAIIAASAGDTIIVKDGKYIENVNVNKRLTIHSENGSENCIIQAAESDEPVFEVTKIGVCTRNIACESEEVGLKLVDSVASKIEKEEDIGKTRLCMWLITGASKKVAREIVNRLNPQLREELQKGGRLK